MKAHDFFAEKKVKEEIRKEIEKYSCLVGKRVKAIPTNEELEDKELEEEIFSIVGLITKEYTTKIFVVLKSEECSMVVNVEAGLIGKERKDYSYNPGFLLELLD